MLLSHGVRGRPMPVRPDLLTRRQHPSENAGDAPRDFRGDRRDVEETLAGNEGTGQRQLSIIPVVLTSTRLAAT